MAKKTGAKIDSCQNYRQQTAGNNPHTWDRPDS